MYKILILLMTMKVEWNMNYACIYTFYIYVHSSVCISPNSVTNKHTFVCFFPLCLENFNINSLFRFSFALIAMILKAFWWWGGLNPQCLLPIWAQGSFLVPGIKSGFKHPTLCTISLACSEKKPEDTVKQIDLRGLLCHLFFHMTFPKNMY